MQDATLTTACHAEQRPTHETQVEAYPADCSGSPLGETKSSPLVGVVAIGLPRYRHRPHGVRLGEVPNSVVLMHLTMN